jgi:hypothetical protein
MASQRKKGQTVGLSLSGISVLLSLCLAVWEMYFFWEAGKGLFGPLHGTLGLFTPDRLGFNMAWGARAARSFLSLAYLSFQLISVPFAMAYREQTFLGVLDGLSSVVPLIVAAVAIAGHPELLKTEGRWEAAILLVCINLADLVGGFAITMGLSRRTVGFGAPARA